MARPSINKAHLADQRFWQHGFHHGRTSAMVATLLLYRSLKGGLRTAHQCSQSPLPAPLPHTCSTNTTASPPLTTVFPPEPLPPPPTAAPLPHWHLYKTPNIPDTWTPSETHLDTNTVTYAWHTTHSTHCSASTTILHFSSMQFLLQTNPRSRRWQPALSSTLQCSNHTHWTFLAPHIPHFSTTTHPPPVQRTLRRQSLHTTQRTFPTNITHHHTGPPRFYARPVEIKPVKDDHLLGFHIDPLNRTVTFQLPTHPWQIRDIQSAGAHRLRLSGLQSRHHTLQQYTYPPSTAQQTSQALVQLYVTKGHSKQHCAAALRPRRTNLACVLQPLLDAPVSAFCVCQPRFRRELFYLSTYFRDAYFTSVQNSGRGAERTCKALPNEAPCKILGSGSWSLPCTCIFWTFVPAVSRFTLLQHSVKLTQHTFFSQGLICSITIKC